MAADIPPFDGHFPGQAPIDAYGNGGFRFAGMSHRGSIICLASGIYAVDAGDAEALALAALAHIATEAEPPIALLLGTGPRQIFPALAVRQRYADLRIGLEPMDTGAAARTYNVLLAERRPIAAALLAVA